MNIDDLNKMKSQIEENYNNLSNPQWVANQLNHLKGKYEILTEVINNYQGDNDASSRPTTKK